MSGVDSVLTTGRMMPAERGRRLKRVCGITLAAGLIGILVPSAGSVQATSFAPANLPAGLSPAAPAAVPAVITDALIIGDSVLSAVETLSSARAALAARHSFVIDAKVCRRLIARSCAYQGVTPSTALEALQSDRGAYRTLVVGVGYNDVALAPAVDALIAEARIRGIEHVVWINYHEAGTYSAIYAQHNATLAAKLAEFSELSVIDWNSAVEQHRDWASNDGLHLTPAGTQAMVMMIGDALDRLVAAPSRPVSRCRATRTSTAPPGSPWAGPGPVGLYPLPAPVRFLDTRQLPTPVDDRGTVTVPIAGQRGIPPDALGVAATVTAVDACATTYLTAYPCGAARPDTSTVNAAAGATVANSVIVGLGRGGALCVYADGATDLIVDVSGYLAPSGEGLSPLPTPVRLIDTRLGTPHLLPDARRLGAGETLTVPAGRFEPVVGSGLLALNITAVQPDGNGYLTVFPGPCSAPRPEASNLNMVAGRDAAAAAIVANRIGGSGDFCVFSSVATDLIVDIDAVSLPNAARLGLLEPARVLDTRRSVIAAAGQERRVDLIAGDDPMPTDGRGIVGNLTAVDPTGDGYLSIYPCGTAVPEVSNLNVHQGDTVANLIVTGLGTNGEVCIYSSVTTHVLLDISAWLNPSGPLPA